MLHSIFISYRRDDTQSAALVAYNELIAHFGTRRVFMDYQSLTLGDEFAPRITSTVERCSIVIVLIGSRWAGELPDGKRRIDQPDDWVRREIGLALARGKRVIPIYLGATPTLQEHELPSDLHQLAKLQHEAIRSARLEHDLRGLIATLRTIDGPPPRSLEGVAPTQSQGFIYLHQFMSRPEFAAARHHVRVELAGKPTAEWTSHDREQANAVATCYDQAQILIGAGAILAEQQSYLLSTSWGESICHQFELLAGYLTQRQTPSASGASFFRHFGEIYEAAARHHPQFIVCSGGQTGVDRAALKAAIDCGIPYQGWVPAEGWAEDMTEPPGLLAVYPRLRATASKDTEVRTKLNVEAASLTMILADGPHRSPGTELTARHADEVGKPCIRIDLRDSKRIATALEGLAVPYRPRLILNVAGPRDSEQNGIEKPAKEFLSELFREIVARRPTEWPADQRKPKPIVED